MVCKNCGAEYDKSSISCPYCGTENAQTAGKQKKEILQGYDREAAKIRKEAETFPQKTANRLTKRIVFAVGILALIGISFTILFIFYGIKNLNCLNDCFCCTINSKFTAVYAEIVA